MGSNGITADVALALYDPNAPTFLYTDDSGVGISVVLSQEQGVGRLQWPLPVTCFSQSDATTAL